MAPSSSRGAVTRSCRKAAMKVRVLQAPKGILQTRRSPRGARPQRRTMLVATAVSSRKTNRWGSSRCCFRRQVRRAAATSGRSCSAACRTFFERQLQMAQKPEDGGDADRNLPLHEPAPQLFQRDVRLLGNPSLQPLGIGCQRISFVTAELCRSHISPATPEPEEPPHRTEAYAMKLRRLFP